MDALRVRNQNGIDWENEAEDIEDVARPLVTPCALVAEHLLKIKRLNPDLHEDYGATHEEAYKRGRYFSA